MRKSVFRLTADKYEQVKKEGCRLIARDINHIFNAETYKAGDRVSIKTPNNQNPYNLHGVITFSEIVGYSRAVPYLPKTRKSYDKYGKYVLYGFLVWGDDIEFFDPNKGEGAKKRLSKMLDAFLEAFKVTNGASLKVGEPSYKVSENSTTLNAQLFNKEDPVASYQCVPNVALEERDKIVERAYEIMESTGDDDIRVAAQTASREYGVSAASIQKWERQRRQKRMEEARELERKLSFEDEIIPPARVCSNWV